MYNSYKKKIIDNFLISKFMIKNVHKLPEIKKISIGSNNSNTRYMLYLATTTILITSKYPKKTFKNTNKLLYIKVNITNKKEVLDYLFKLIYLVYTEIPGFKGFNTKYIKKNVGIFNLNFLPYSNEINKKVNRNELPLRNKDINYNLKIIFKNGSKKNQNIFLLKSLQFPIL